MISPLTFPPSNPMTPSLKVVASFSLIITVTYIRHGSYVSLHTRSYQQGCTGLWPGQSSQRVTALPGEARAGQATGPLPLQPPSWSWWQAGRHRGQIGGNVEATQQEVAEV